MTTSQNLSQTSEHALRAVDLKKRFGHGEHAIEALKGVSFTVNPGEVFSILGPNGAGKTTLLRILTSITRPDSGEAWLDGINIQKSPRQARSRLGVVFQNNQFNRYLSLWQNLVLHARMHGLSASEYEPRITELLKQQGLYQRRNQPTEPLSGGMKRRAALLRALIQQPAVLFLDEPTTGLDPHARRELWATLAEMKSRTTVILTTHYMEEADALSDRILLLNHGRVMQIDTPQALKRAASPHQQYELELNAPEAAMLHHQLSANLPNCVVLREDNPYRLTLEACEEAAFWQLVSTLPPGLLSRAGRVTVDLEAVFLSMGQLKTSPESAS